MKKLFLLLFVAISSLAFAQPIQLSYFSTFPKSDNPTEINIVDTKTKPSIKITKEERDINGYKCKKAIVVDFGITYVVWFTEEMNYNWLFIDFLYKIPGTAVLVENEEKVVLELKTINKIDYSKSELKAEDILYLMSLWK